MQEHPSLAVKVFANFTLSLPEALGCAYSIFPSILKAARSKTMGGIFPESFEKRCLIAGIGAAVTGGANYYFVSGSLPTRVNQILGRQTPIHSMTIGFATVVKFAAFCAAIMDAVPPAQSGVMYSEEWMYRNDQTLAKLNQMMLVANQTGEDIHWTDPMPGFSYTLGGLTWAAFSLIYSGEFARLAQEIVTWRRGSNEYFHRQLGKAMRDNPSLTALVFLCSAIGASRIYAMGGLTYSKGIDLVDPGWAGIFAALAAAGSSGLMQGAMMNLAKCLHAQMPCLPSSCCLPDNNTHQALVENFEVPPQCEGMTKASLAKIAVVLALFAINAGDNSLLMASGDEDGVYTAKEQYMMAAVFIVSFGVCAKGYLEELTKAKAQRLVAAANRARLWSKYGTPGAVEPVIDRDSAPMKFAKACGRYGYNKATEAASCLASWCSSWYHDEGSREDDVVGEPTNTPHVSQIPL